MTLGLVSDLTYLQLVQVHEPCYGTHGMLRRRYVPFHGRRARSGLSQAAQKRERVTDQAGGCGSTERQRAKDIRGRVPCDALGVRGASYSGDKFVRKRWYIVPGGPRSGARDQ